MWQLLKEKGSGASAWRAKETTAAEWDLRRKPGAAVDNTSRSSTKPGDRACGSATPLHQRTNDVTFPLGLTAPLRSTALGWKSVQSQLVA